MKTRNGTTLLVLLLAVLAFAQSASAFYDASLGRWVNRDPLGESGFEVIHGGRNLLPIENNYAFVGNAPATAIDPLGLEFVYWPPKIDGDCRPDEERECQETCFRMGLVLKRCTVHKGHYTVESFSNGVVFYRKTVHWRQPICECVDPRTCPPPPGSLGKGRNNPPPNPPRW